MDLIQLIVLAESEFEGRTKSNLITTFSIISVADARRIIDYTFYSEFFYTEEHIDWDFDACNPPAIREKVI